MEEEQYQDPNFAKFVQKSRAEYAAWVKRMMEQDDEAFDVRPNIRPGAPEGWRVNK